ncbi:MAG TPA: hypothetical protein VG733_20240, partial [Chthoniobacteraceae bacterium]|nr:hypothetical protein [Chthoniobacteraceae bacterium]
MAGTIIESQLSVTTGRESVRFATASGRDDEAIRRLLRENPLRGAVSLTFEREPGYFLGAQIADADDETILAHENGRLVCMGRSVVRECHVNGEPRRTGYLSDLRLDASARGRFDILRRGYRFFRELHRGNPPDICFTSVTSDNVRSLRFLERGLPGMPVYEPLAGITTLAIPVPRDERKLARLEERALAHLKSWGLSVIPATEKHIGPLAECLDAHASRHNLAAAWTADKIRLLHAHGLAPGDFQLLMEGVQIAGCAALWDQRGFKQTVIRGYRGAIAWSRPWLNLLADCSGMPRLPRPGSALAHGFLSPLAIPNGRGHLVPHVIESMLPFAARRGLDFLTLGFAADDARLPLLRSRFRCREYSNRLFRVRWRDAET